MINCTSDNRLC